MLSPRKTDSPRSSSSDIPQSPSGASQRPPLDQEIPKAPSSQPDNSNQFFGALVNHLPGMVYRCKQDHCDTLTFASEGCRQITGFESHELTGKNSVSYSSLVHPEDRDKRQAQLQAITSHSTSTRCAYRITKKTGETRFVEESVTIVRDGSSATPYIEAFVQDITERKREAAELARSRELLELTGSLAKIGGWQVHLDTMKLEWTLQTFRIAEIEPPQEPPLEKGINLFAPDARPIITAAVQAAIEHGTPYDLELPIITAKGRKRWVQTQGYAEMQNGKSVRLFGTFQDITERKQIQKALVSTQKDNNDLRAAIDEHAIVAITDAHGRITFVNDKFCAISQYSREELIGEDHRMISSGYHSESFFRDLWDTIQSGQAWRGEIKNRAKDGSLYWVDTTIIPIIEASGQIRQFIAIRKDITDRKQAEADLRESEFRWKFALEGSGDGLWDWNLAEDSVHFSKRWKEMLGYGKHEISNDFEEWQKRVHPEDFNSTTTALKAHLDGASPHYAAELRMRCKDGRWKWILTRGLVVERDA